MRHVYVLLKDGKVVSVHYDYTPEVQQLERKTGYSVVVTSIWG